MSKICLAAGLGAIMVAFAGPAFAQAQPVRVGGLTNALTIHDICALGPRLVAITHGAKSIEYGVADKLGEIAVDQVQAIDSLGAGDILHGAFCHFLATGLDELDALAQAATVASKSTESFGTRAWIESLNN